MLVNVFITSRVDYCNSVLVQSAAVHLHPLQSVAAAKTNHEKAEIWSHHTSNEGRAALASWFTIIIIIITDILWRAR